MRQSLTKRRQVGLPERCSRVSSWDRPARGEIRQRPTFLKHTGRTITEMRSLMATSTRPPKNTGRAHRSWRVLSRVSGAALLVIVFMSGTGGQALAVVRGKTVSITSVPWTVVIWKRSPYAGRPPYAGCTGVIIRPRYVLTAGHCVMSGNTGRLLPETSIGVEAGTSNFQHLPASDHPQARAVTAIRVIPGYVASSKLSSRNATQSAAHDLAVLRLSRPLSLNDKDVRAAALPTTSTPRPSGGSKLVIAGFGNKSQRATIRMALSTRPSNPG